MKKSSFTLIEIMVVVFIIVILASLSVVIFQRGNFGAKQRDGERKQNVNEIASAIEAFKADHGHYPLINWGPGFHAYEGFGYSATDCYTNAVFGNNTAWDDKLMHTPPYTHLFDPGTEIRFTTDPSTGQLTGCDDLSLQLLGKAYLPKMPFIETNMSTDDSFSVWNIDPAAWGYRSDHGSLLANLWVYSGPQLKQYLDEIPPLPTGAPPTFYSEYFYNSYYDCACEKVYYGDRYWLEIHLENENTGGEQNPDDGEWYYEVGTMNWTRQPRTECGC